MVWAVLLTTPHLTDRPATTSWRRTAAALSATATDTEVLLSEWWFGLHCSVWFRKRERSLRTWGSRRRWRLARGRPTEAQSWLRWRWRVRWGWSWWGRRLGAPRTTQRLPRRCAARRLPRRPRSRIRRRRWWWRVVRRRSSRPPGGLWMNCKQLWTCFHFPNRQADLVTKFKLSVWKVFGEFINPVYWNIWQFWSTVQTTVLQSWRVSSEVLLCVLCFFGEVSPISQKYQYKWMI